MVVTNGLWLDFDVHADQSGWDNMLDDIAHDHADEGRPSVNFDDNNGMRGLERAFFSQALGLSLPPKSTQSCASIDHEFG